jgi:tRNA(Ile)-lysidine synthase
VPSPLLRLLARALDAPGAPRRDDRVLVAASGGPDSTALLAALVALGPSRALRIAAVHVEHGLRGNESCGDRSAVEALARRLGVRCAIAAAPVAPGANLEERARIARHRALRAVALEEGAACVALAHTQDDQVETVLLRLLRGTGRRGLGGIHPRRGLLWRPLLDVTRADVRRWLADEDLPFRLDRTNADLAHARNRLRRLVVPLLAREFNPRLGDTVAALAERLRDEDAFLDDVARTRLEAHRRGDALATAVAMEPRAVGRRIVRAWLDEAGPRAVAAREVERTLGLARGSASGNVAVPGPARIVREDDVLVRRTGREDTSAPFRLQLRPGSSIVGPAGEWRIALSEPRARHDDDLTGLTPAVARFDAAALALPLVVRRFERGDRIDVPRVGRRKLQDVFVDAKVPRERRRMLPIVADATGTIVWVPGVVRAAAALLTPATALVLDARIE